MVTSFGVFVIFFSVRAIINNTSSPIILKLNSFLSRYLFLSTGQRKSQIQKLD